MAIQVESSRVIRFGAFELDAAKGELRKEGILLKMYPQPLRVLLLLAERPGQTVTREEIQHSLWGDNTFVNFERGINFCINQVRVALGDDAEEPRYVETLPRRGYRFIAPVKIDVAIAPTAVSAQMSQLPAGEVSPSVAVLPFENLSGDPAQDYFADGMTETLITQLGKISALRVISRQSIMQYAGTKKSVPQIADELKISAVIEGSVLRLGDRVRVSVQLIEAVPERHLWAESYDRQVQDVLALHGEIARTIAREIKVTLTPQEDTRLADGRAVNPAVNEAHFRSRSLLDRRTKADIDEALVAAHRAIELDPFFAPAYASLAEAYLALGFYEPGRGTELTAKANTASRKALGLDDSLSSAHYTLAAIHGTRWDWPEAEVEYQQAIELNPSNALAHLWYSDLLLILGRVNEAEAEAQRALELDPLSFQAYYAVGAHLYYARRYGEFIEQCQGWVKRNPNLDWNRHHGLGGAYLQMGRCEEAIAELRAALKSSTMYEHTATELAYALAVAGKRKAALKVLRSVQNVPWKTFGAALVQTGLGERDKAFTSLEQAIELRAPLVILLKVDPRFDALRPDPRFPNLLRRVNLPE
jgi:TolB-like protein/Tfp pilus assembly protein PilF